MFPSFWPRHAAIHRSDSTYLATLTGFLAGLLLPLGILMLGWIIEMMVAAVLGSVPSSVRVGPFVLMTEWLQAGNSAIRAVSVLVVVLAIIALIQYLAVGANEWAANQAAFDFDRQTQKRLFEKSNALAIEDGLSVHRSAVHEIREESIPKVREAIAAWYTAFPRYLLYIGLLLALALSIHPWLTATALFGLVVLRSVYFYLQSRLRRERPVQQERWRAARERLAYLCDNAPLLASIHDAKDTAHEYESQLQSYRNLSLQLADPGGWHSPTLRLISILLATIMAMLVAIRVLDRESSVGLGGAVALCASVAIAVVTFSHAAMSITKRRKCQGPLQKMVDYLSQGETLERRSLLKEPSKIERELAFDHLMLRENSGRKLLENISFTMRPGQLTAIVGTDGFQTRALAELCLGFGKPTSGRMLIDGTDSIDLTAASLQRLSLWVAPHGPLVSGSIEENLWINMHPDASLDVMDAARKARVADAIMNLPEGMRTLVSPTEERLAPDILFRIGLARAFAKNPSVVVAEEPRPSEAAIEAGSSDALVELKKQGVIVVVLPTRLSTLRAADQVVILHDHHVADVGTHAELLERSELYRHLNYQRFNRSMIG